MGLFDWLGDALGGSSNISGTPVQPGPGAQVGELDPMGSPTGQMMPMPTGTSMPSNPYPLNDVGVGMDAPQLPTPQNTPESSFGQGAPPGLMYPPAEDPMQSGGMNPGGLPPSPPMAMKDTATKEVQPLPPPGNGTNGVGPGLGVGEGVNGPMILDSYRNAGGTMMDPGRSDIGGSPQARSFIGRALGLDPNTEKVLSGSLGAGLKAAGENSNKGKGAAFMGSAGSAIEGGDKADDKIYDQKDKYLQRAIAAKREGNHAEYQKNYLAYQIAATKEKLAQTKEKAASGSVMNSPSQLYLRADALAITANGALKSQYDKTAQQFGADSKEAKAALDAYNKGVEAEREAQYAKHGLDPKKAAEIGKQPGMSDKNPVKDFPKDPAAAQKAFDALPEGAYFVNPKDGRLLRKKAANGAGAANPAQGPQQSALMPPMPPMPLDPNQEAA